MRSVAVYDSMAPADGAAEPRRRRTSSEVRMVAAQETPSERRGEVTIGGVFMEVMSWTENDAPQPSRAEFERMVEESPARLAAWVFDGKLPRGHLSHAAEILGRGTASCPASGGVEFVLTRLLEHPSPVVREGAVYGLGYRLTRSVRTTLEKLSREDSSDGVREAAEEVLEG